MLNTMIVAAVTNFSGTTTPDKNGAVPVMLQCIAGTMPNRNVLSGTVAQRAGFDVGRTYLVNVRETGYDEVFGPDFTFVKIMELKSGLDIVQASKELGTPTILYVQRPEGFEQHYQRKGDAVESNRTSRIRQGLYKPAIQTTVGSHETAREVREGTSVGSGGTVINADEWLASRGVNMEDEEIFPEPDEAGGDLPEEFYEGEDRAEAGEEEHEESGEQTPPPTRRTTKPTGTRPPRKNK
jgi:hypothetical protein